MISKHARQLIAKFAKSPYAERYISATTTECCIVDSHPLMVPADSIENPLLKAFFSGFGGTRSPINSERTPDGGYSRVPVTENIYADGP